MTESTPNPSNSKSLDAKINRNDVEAYKAAFLFRQRVINEKIVEWYGGVKRGATVFDACAGPEGSYLATTRRGGKWFGNEISIKTAKHLKATGAQTVVGNADQLPFSSESMDVVLYVFAFNNIENTEGALSEARRILKPGGSVLISDPGQTMWATDLYLYEAMEQGLLNNTAENLLRKAKRFNTEIPEYFSEYPERKGLENTTFPLRKLYGLDFQAASDIANQIKSGGDIKKLRRDFHELLEGQYWAYIFSIAEKLGFSFKKLGVIATTQNKGQEDWNVGDVVDLKTPKSAQELSDSVISLRNNSHPLSFKVVQSGSKVSKNIVSPVVLLEK